MSYSQQDDRQEQARGEGPRPLTPQELHERQRELVRQSLSACPAAKKAPGTHRRWA